MYEKYLTGLIENNNMLAMGSCRNGETKQIDAELNHLRKSFKALTANNKNGVLKTAQGLLKIQRVCRTMVMDNTRYIDFSVKNKKR